MVCSNCGTQNNEGSGFCTKCGMSLVQQRADAQQAGEQGNPYGQYQNPYGQGNPYGQYVYKNPYDHTEEFDKADISENKVFAMLPYIMGWVGVIIALLASRESKYVGFHTRQALKLVVSKTLLSFVALILCWTFIAPIVAGVFYAILWVVQIVSFFSVCSGKAVEAHIVRELGFLK